MEKEKIGERFQQVIDSVYHGNASKMARFLNKKPQAIYEILKGKNNMSLEILQNLMHELKVDPVWLLTGEGEMFRGMINEGFINHRSNNSGKQVIQQANVSIIEAQKKTIEVLERENQLLRQLLKSKK